MDLLLSFRKSRPNKQSYFWYKCHPIQSGIMRTRTAGWINSAIFADLIGGRQGTLIEDKQFLLVAETESDREKQRREIQIEWERGTERKRGRETKIEATAAAVRLLIRTDPLNLKRRSPRSSLHCRFNKPVNSRNCMGDPLFMHACSNGIPGDLLISFCLRYQTGQST